MFVTHIPATSRIISSTTQQPLQLFASGRLSLLDFSLVPSACQSLKSSICGTSIPNSRANFRSFAVKRSKPMAPIASLAPVEILVKAATGDPNRLGDCPFCHRVLLTLEEKKIPYESKLVDLSNKPDWFLEINPGGKVPVIKHDGKWVPDSDVIVDILEKEHPEPSLIAPEEFRTVGGPIFSSFVKFLKSKDPKDGTEEALVDELTKFDEHLKTHGPFVNGKNVSSIDLALAPKLYHLRIALEHYKKWTIPESLSHVLNYIKTIEARESFQNTSATPEFVVKGWESHLSS